MLGVAPTCFLRREKSGGHLSSDEYNLRNRYRISRIATFGHVAAAFLAAKETGWRNAKHRAQWHMTLEVYAAPLRAMPVDEVDTAAVLAVLRPIWSTKPETASRLRGRIEAVIDAARVSGHIGRNEANPARWKGHLEKLLPRARKLARGHPCGNGLQ